MQRTSLARILSHLLKHYLATNIHFWPL